MALPRLNKAPGRPQPSDVQDSLADWFDSDLGSLLIQKEKEILDEVLPSLFGYHLIYTGLSKFASLVNASPIKNKIYLNTADDNNKVNARPSQLPIQSDSTDLVVFHHSLDFEKDPYQVLREGARAIIPNGHIIIVGFNPWSLWGLWRAVLFRSSQAPWIARFISPYRLSEWLNILEFDVVGCESGFYLPPYHSLGMKESLNWIDHTGSQWLTQRGGLYVLVAKKRVSCITPIRLQQGTRKRRLIPVPATAKVFPNQQNSTDTSK